MDIETNAPSPKGERAVTLTKSALEGLLAIAQPQGLQRSLPQLYFDPREAIIVAANPMAMLWRHERFHTSADAFSLSSAACEDAVECATDPSTPIEIWIADSHVHSRRRTTLLVGGQAIVELECLPSFPHPRGALAARPNTRPVEFPPDDFKHLRNGLSQVSGCKAGRVYIMPRGSAPAFVVTPNAETMGFFLPQPRSTSVSRPQRASLPVPVSAKELETAQRYAREALRTFRISEPVGALVSINPPPSRRPRRPVDAPAVAQNAPVADTQTTELVPLNGVLSVRTDP